MDKLIRSLQIDLIMDNPNPIIECFNNICDGISSIEKHVYHTEGGETIYYNSNRQWIFYHDKLHDRFWCNYAKYWEIFESNFVMDYAQIKKLTKLLVENSISKVEITPFVKGLTRNDDIENAVINYANITPVHPKSNIQEIKDVLKNKNPY